MPPLIFATMVASVVLGLVMIPVGWRGWRINRHPICTLCRFDLVGLYPQQITCPECGAGLRRRKGVRIGARRRLWPFIGLGVILILAPLAPLGLVLYGAATGADINKHKPLGLLLWEARIASPKAMEAIGSELHLRLRGNRLDEAQRQRLLETTLRIHSDRSRPWDSNWASFLTWMHTSGEMKPEDIAQYCLNAVALEPASRAKVAPGDLLPVEVRFGEERLADRMNVEIRIVVGACYLNGTRLQEATEAALLRGGPDPVPYTRQAAFLASPLSFFNRHPHLDRSHIAVLIPEGTSPGAFELDIEVEVAARLFRGSPLNAAPPGVPHESTTHEYSRTVCRFTTPFEVVPGAEHAVSIALPNEELARRIESVLNAAGTFQFSHLRGASTAERHLNGTAFEFDIVVPSGSLPVQLVGRVVERVDGVDFDVGTILTQSESGLSSFYGGGHGMRHVGRLVYVVPHSGGTRTDKLILVPDPEVARRSVDAVHIYGGEITIDRPN